MYQPSPPQQRHNLHLDPVVYRDSLFPIVHTQGIRVVEGRQDNS